MDHIYIYSGKEPISSILISRCTDTKDLESCIKPYGSIYAIIDRNLRNNSAFAGEIMGFLQMKGIPVHEITASEQEKTLDTVMDICSWLLEEGADRDALVLAIGGGITSDMVGFAASIYKRGVRFAYMPTTLLAQVDAAIGGKTGVNFLKYKNILGVIRQPEWTFLSPAFLKTLPRRDFLSGAAEMLKTFIIEDNGNYTRAVELLSSEADPAKAEELTDLISAAAAVKAGVVSRDQFESGERRKLNLGHTFAHAVETLAQRKSMDITHGEAVAIGMVLAARLADRLTAEGRFDAETGMEARLVKDMEACGLPHTCPFGMADMAAIMKKDKKAEGAMVHFVLPRRIGDVVTMELAVEDVCSLLK